MNTAREWFDALYPAPARTSDIIMIQAEAYAAGAEAQRSSDAKYITAGIYYRGVVMWAYDQVADKVRANPLVTLPKGEG